MLGVPGDPNVEVQKILVREQVEEQHPDAAVREAEAMSARLARARPEGRRDLRDVPLPTIDPEDARDHDDAIWVDKLGDGYRAYVAIADVSEYVQPGSALDDEAHTRGCTIYLPDRAIPMLPAALAADLCSLLPEQERLALCVIADLDVDGNVERFELVEGADPLAGDAHLRRRRARRSASPRPVRRARKPKRSRRGCACSTSSRESSEDGA